ncbi:hypothetical protein [Sphingopyxis solisilvae]|uniref:hypothetical protein n=1 Tax=Sphingopyxis solisilvae TaxID=1886788 RepID=UPI00189288B8|nr:hypothetical protein [Sphingopyxis solisilvae]
MNVDSWRSSIANADFADWITVAAYLGTALLARRASLHAAARNSGPERRFWRSTSVLLVFLAVNELLDLQTLLTIAGRAHAKAYGWYGAHRPVQFAFVVGLAAFAMIAGATLLWWLRRAHRAVRLAFVGLGFVGLFILMRAASFHHLDELLGRGNPIFPWGSIQEMAGIMIIAAAAWVYSRQVGGNR